MRSGVDLEIFWSKIFFLNYASSRVCQTVYILALAKGPRRGWVTCWHVRTMCTFGGVDPSNSNVTYMPLLHVNGHRPISYCEQFHVQTVPPPSPYYNID